jgi:two-component system chemotaxis response regulator CheB
MVSSITFEGGQATFQALDAGALDYIQKPKAQASSSLNNVAKEIILKIRAILESPLAQRMKNDVQFLDRDKSTV